MERLSQFSKFFQIFFIPDLKAANCSGYRERIAEINSSQLNGNEKRAQLIRVVVDVIAEMTEHNAYQTYRRLTRHSPASFLDFAQR